MLSAVLDETAHADALVMAAAVADFRPVSPAAHKIKKEDGAPTIVLEHNPDILKAVASRKSDTGFPRVTIGFAAESQSLLENARKKLASKKLDLIVANDISALGAGFAGDTNRVTLLGVAEPETLPLMSKDEVAEVVIRRLVSLLMPKSGISWIVHLCKKSEWEAAQQVGEYHTASLDQIGFIHCSRLEQVVGVANRYFAGQPDLVLLWIDPACLSTEVRWESSDGDTYPHVYGSIALAAVAAVTDCPADSDGVFRQTPFPPL
jgi:uncharacterized protein (DUF952 family)